MAFTAANLLEIETAIMSLTAGSQVASVSSGSESISYTQADLKKLQNLRTQIQMELGVIQPRAYAKNGGRG